jgi:hypothetical protein
MPDDCEIKYLHITCYFDGKDEIIISLSLKLKFNKEGYIDYIELGYYNGSFIYK